MKAFTCMCMRTKPLEAICTRTCEARNPDANGICADMTGADRFPTLARSASDQATLKIASKWGTRRVIPPLARLTGLRSALGAGLK
jgi:hypothetical protein